MSEKARRNSKRRRSMRPPVQQRRAALFAKPFSVNQGYGERGRRANFSLVGSIMITLLSSPGTAEPATPARCSQRHRLVWNESTSYIPYPRQGSADFQITHSRRSAFAKLDWRFSCAYGTPWPRFPYSPVAFSAHRQEFQD